VLVHIARYQAEAGDVTGSQQTFLKARETALAISDNRDQLYALRDIGQVQAESGDKAGSKQTFQLAIRTVSSMTPNQRASELGSIARAQVQTGDRTGAAETLSLIADNARELPPRDEALALTRRAGEYLMLDDREAARAELNKVFPKVREIADTSSTTGSDRDAIYSWLARLAAEAQALELALVVVATIKDGQSKARAARDVVTVLSKVRNRTGVSEAIQKLAQEVTPVAAALSFPKDLTLFDVAVVQAAAGDLKGAAQIADRIVDVKHGMREMAYMEMVKVLIEKSDWPAAQHIITGISQHSSATFETYGKLTKAQARAGDGKNAAEWARQQVVPLARTYALLGAAEGLMDYGGIEQLRHAVWP